LFIQQVFNAFLIACASRRCQTNSQCSLPLLKVGCRKCSGYQWITLQNMVSGCWYGENCFGLDWERTFCALLRVGECISKAISTFSCLQDLMILSVPSRFCIEEKSLLFSWVCSTVTKSCTSPNQNLCKL